MRYTFCARVPVAFAALALAGGDLAGQTLPAQLEEACRSCAERAWECVHRSAVLNRDERYTLVLPERTPARAALVVFLHGSGRNHRTLVEQASTRETLASSRHLILMPDGGASWWIAPGRQSHVIELTDMVARAFGIPPERRGCGGWSMGAYGSVRLMQEYPGTFTSWTGILGLLDFPNPDYPEQANHAVPPVFGPREDWPRHNPMAWVARLSGKSLWFATARDAFDYGMNAAFHRKLNELKIPHEFKTLDGGHVFPVVAEALPEALRFHERALGAAHAH